jgi:hypothetical protein
MLNAILTLLSVVFLVLIALLIRPQLAARFVSSVPSRRKLLFPFAACLILVAVLDNATPHRTSEDGDGNASNAAQPATAFRQISCSTPDCQLRRSVANAAASIRAAQSNGSSGNCASEIQYVQQFLSMSVDEMGGPSNAAQILDSRTNELRRICGV